MWGQFKKIQKSKSELDKHAFGNSEFVEHEIKSFHLSYEHGTHSKYKGMVLGTEIEILCDTEFATAEAVIILTSFVIDEKRFRKYFNNEALSPTRWQYQSQV